MRTLIPMVLLMACAKGEETTATTDTQDPPESDTDTDTDGDADTDTDSDADADTDTTDTETGTPSDTAPTEPACDSVTAGEDWAWRGSCPGMETPCEIEVNGCDLAIAYSSGMSMGMPTGGLIAGSDATFDARGCVGTVTSPDAIEGTCDGGGCTFTLTR